MMIGKYSSLTLI